MQLLNLLPLSRSLLAAHGPSSMTGFAGMGRKGSRLQPRTGRASLRSVGAKPLVTPLRTSMLPALVAGCVSLHAVRCVRLHCLQLVLRALLPHPGSVLVWTEGSGGDLQEAVSFQSYLVVT